MGQTRSNGTRRIFHFARVNGRLDGVFGKDVGKTFQLLRIFVDILQTEHLVTVDIFGYEVVSLVIKQTITVAENFVGRIQFFAVAFYNFLRLTVDLCRNEFLQCGANRDIQANASGKTI